MSIEMDYKWINGPDCDPDWYCALVSPQVIDSADPSTDERPAAPSDRGVPPSRRKVGKRIRPPVVAIEPGPNRPVLTVPEAAWILHCSPNTVWNLIATGQLTSFKLGRKRLVARETVETFIYESEVDL